MNKKVLLTLSALGIFTFSSQVLSPVFADTTENPPTENANHQLSEYGCCTNVLM